MWVKICANTNLEDARLAAELGVEAVGFVLAPSRRQVTAEQVAEITPKLPPGVERVGVFRSDDAFELEHYAAEAGLTAVQLHGPFRAALVREFAAETEGRVKVIQTVAYEVEAADREDVDARFEAALRLVFSEPRVWAVLIDAAKGGRSGGLGVAFDWAHVGAIVERAVKAFASPRVILAGGLTPENVAEAIRTVRPWGVDVASGVEAAPGKKDAARVRAFVAAARAASLTG